MTALTLVSGAHGALVFDKAYPPPTLWEYNFVYGPNGSGKTSLADAISVACDDQTLRIARFDRDYAQAALAQTNAVEGLWVVSPEAKSLVAERDELQQKLMRLRADLEKHEVKQRETEAAYQGFIKPLATELRDLKRLAHRDASNYSPRQVEDRFVSLAPKRPAKRNLADLRKRIEQDPLRPIGRQVVKSAIATLDALKTAVATLDVGSIARAHREAWIADQARSEQLAEGDPCPYCEHPLGAGAVKRIRAVASRDAATDPVHAELVQCLRAIRAGLIQSWPASEDFEYSLQENAAQVIPKCQTGHDELRGAVPDDALAIHDLIQQGDKGDPPPWLASAETFRGELAAVLQVIDDHARAVENDHKARQNAFADYEVVRLSATEAEYKKLDKARGDAVDSATSAQDAIRTTAEELSEVEVALRGLLDPQLLNDDLSRYLGHQAIRFEAQKQSGSDAGYRIVRADGRDVGRLSEGEATAISLLYFLRGVREDPETPGVVVIDDPVTSLDDSGVFTAHSFIKEAVARNHGDEGPLVVITTHNHSYFRLLVDWHVHLNRKDRERARLFETVAYVDGEHRTTCRLREMPEGLARAGSEYSILLAHLVDYIKTKDDDPNALSVYIAPNIARRVLEGFLTFKFGGPRRAMIGDLLVLAFNDPRLREFGEERRGRLHKLLDSSSHGSSLTDTYQPIASRAEVSTVIADVVDLIRAVDPDHLKGFEK